MFGINSARFSTRLRRPPTSHPHHSLQYGLPPRPSFWARLGKGLAYSQGLTQGAEWGKGRRLGSQDRATGARSVNGGYCRSVKRGYCTCPTSTLPRDPKRRGRRPSPT